MNCTKTPTKEHIKIRQRSCRIPKLVLHENSEYLCILEFRLTPSQNYLKLQCPIENPHLQAIQNSRNRQMRTLYQTPRKSHPKLCTYI